MSGIIAELTAWASAMTLCAAPVMAWAPTLVWPTAIDVLAAAESAFASAEFTLLTVAVESPTALVAPRTLVFISLTPASRVFMPESSVAEPSDAFVNESLMTPRLTKSALK